MTVTAALVVAGLVMFALSLMLFQRNARHAVGVGSLWKGGAGGSRFALLFWWMSLLLLLMSVYRAAQGES